MPEHMAMPVESKMNDVAGQMKMKELRIRQLDDGSFILTMSMEGKDKKGMHHYDEKQSSHETPEDVSRAIMAVLKRRFSDKKSKTHGLAERGESK